ncbi:prolactin receptor-like isoform X2 [Toxotes jaculatrix]|uniref:prolactin receptor-like isoform X2 n=1 Tax=Toxotes jaculatrix TaxID=941984 RepID=UPI001B3B1B3B|nr:prolactin receptor-like isoform X2 [Toxotes jaculatrix]
MKLFLVHLILLSCFLDLWALQETEGNNQDVCQELEEPGELKTLSSLQEDVKDHTDVNGTFVCLRYPTNLLNCSWSFDPSYEDAQLSVHISICEYSTSVQSQSFLVERVGSRTLNLQPNEMLTVVIQFNFSWHDHWNAYLFSYDEDLLEFRLPPTNVSATVKDGGLLVTWGPPPSDVNYSCFEYELDLGDQETPKRLSARSYTEHNVDPNRIYRVRVRTRMKGTCYGNLQWSEWSPTVTVKLPDDKTNNLSVLLLVLISLGIPMILLAVLLLVRYQRVSKVLFPPIPRPPPKYMYFLEKNDTFNVFHPATPPKPEEITEVEDAE